jgi:hypothetical protein
MLNQNVRPKSGPSAALYAVAVVIIIAGLIFGIFQCAKSFENYEEWLTYVTVPGTKTITLSEPGKYTIYHEHTTVLNGQPYSPTGAGPGDLDYTLTDKASGKQVPLTSPTTNEAYTLGARQGVAIMVFSIDEPGDYEFTAKYRDGRSEPKLVIAIGQGIVKRIFAGILIPMVAVGLGLVVGVIIIIVTAVGRGRAKRAAFMYQQQQMMYPPPPPPPGGQFPGAGG